MEGYLVARISGLRRDHLGELMEFRIVESRFGVLLYPVPVNKAEPYLVIARDRADAEDLKAWLETERIQPLTSAHFQQTGVHVDGVTKLLAKKP